MNNFLTFLSNNYLYFLIAAGILFFALLGFIIDLKKKKDEFSSSNETPIPDVTPIEEKPSDVNAVNTNVVEENQINLNEVETISNDFMSPFNSAPAMPEEPTDVEYNDLNNVPNNDNVIMPEVSQTNSQSNQNETLEEFK